jgi:hypothetical protein
MSFDGHVLCQRIEIGAACPVAIIGKPSVAPAAAAPVAAFRKWRRVAAAAGACGWLGGSVLRVIEILLG